MAIGGARESQGRACLKLKKHRVAQKKVAKAKKEAKSQVVEVACLAVETFHTFKDFLRRK